MSVLQLDLVSPKLLSATGLSLAVPGTYRVDGSCVRIHKFLPIVQVLYFFCFCLFAEMTVLFMSYSSTPEYDTMILLYDTSVSYYCVHMYGMLSGDDDGGVEFSRQRTRAFLQRWRR